MWGFVFILPLVHPAGPVYKEENAEDPYSFVDEETGVNRTAAAPAVDSIKTEPTTAPAPKKRGRKKKILTEPVPRYIYMNASILILIFHHHRNLIGISEFFPHVFVYVFFLFLFLHRAVLSLFLIGTLSHYHQ